MIGWKTITFSIGREVEAKLWYARNKNRYQIKEIYVNNCCAAYDYKPLIKL